MDQWNVWITYISFPLSFPILPLLFVHPLSPSLHQLLLCLRAEDVILVTFNHLDAVRDMVGDSDKHISLLNSIHQEMCYVSYLWQHVSRQQ